MRKNTLFKKENKKKKKHTVETSLNLIKILYQPTIVKIDKNNKPKTKQEALYVMSPVLTFNPSIRRPGMLPMYVLRCPLISASSLTPPRDMRKNFLSNAAAIDDANDVFPTPGGPTKHNIGPLASGLSCTSGDLNQQQSVGFGGNQT